MSLVCLVSWRWHRGDRGQWGKLSWLRRSLQHFRRHHFYSEPVRKQHKKQHCDDIHHIFIQRTLKFPPCLPQLGWSSTTSDDPEPVKVPEHALRKYEPADDKSGFIMSAIDASLHPQWRGATPSRSSDRPAEQHRSAQSRTGLKC